MIDSFLTSLAFNVQTFPNQRKLFCIKKLHRILSVNRAAGNTNIDQCLTKTKEKKALSHQAPFFLADFDFSLSFSTDVRTLWFMINHNAKLFFVRN